MKGINRIGAYIRTCIPQYGIITVLVYLHKLEQQEKYEMCQTVVDAIKRFNTVYGYEMPTRLTNKVLKNEQKRLNQNTKEITFSYYSDFSVAISKHIDVLQRGTA